MRCLPFAVLLLAVSLAAAKDPDPDEVKIIVSRAEKAAMIKGRLTTDSLRELLKYEEGRPAAERVISHWKKRDLQTWMLCVQAYADKVRGKDVPDHMIAEYANCLAYQASQSPRTGQVSPNLLERLAALESRAAPALPLLDRLKTVPDTNTALAAHRAAKKIRAAAME